MTQKSKRFLVVTSIIGLLSGGLLINRPRAHAAVCPTTDAGYGSITGTVNILQTGTYRVWNRIKATSANNDSFWLIIDGTMCYNVGDSSTVIPNNQWVWIDWQDASSASKINTSFTTTGNHTIKLLGREADVQVDRVLFTTDTTSINCSPPQGTGDTCAVNSPTVTLTPTPTITPTPVVTPTPIPTTMPTITPTPTPTPTPVPVPATTSGTLTGTLIDITGNVPRKAHVSIIINGSSKNYVPAANGSYSIPNLAPASYTVTYSGLKFKSQTFSIPITSGSTIIKNVVLLK